MGTAVSAYLATRRPSIGFFIFVILGALVLTGLGTWQLMRLHWKNELILETKDKLAQPLQDKRVRWPDTKKEWQVLSYQPIVVRGVWLPLYRFKLAPRTYEEQVGYHLLVPLQLTDGQVLLVNRGFVPNRQAILPSLPDEQVEVQGVGLVPPRDKPWQTPENIPSRGLWTWTDMRALKYEIGVKKMAPLVLYESRDPDSSNYPIGGQLPMPLTNRHAQYAMTWFMLAFVLLLIGFLASGAPTDKASSAAEAEPTDPVARRGKYPEPTD